MKFSTSVFVGINVIVSVNVAAMIAPILSRTATNQKYFDLQNSQALESVIMSIDARLKNLDQFCSLYYSTDLQNKLTFYERKVDKIEKEMLRMEMRIKTELDKISENISNKHFTDDIIAERIMKKVNTAFDRISNKYENIENGLDLISTKIQNTRDNLVTKLDKIDEALYIRDEENAAEVEDTVDELKKVCLTVEENIINKTEEHFKKLLKQAKAVSDTEMSENPSVSKSSQEHSRNSDSFHTNFSGIEMILEQNKLDIEDSINDFTNKVTDMKYNVEETLENFQGTLKSVIYLVNATRKEQENNFRELTEMVGSRNGKPSSTNFLLDGSESQKLSEISMKLDKNFKRLIAAQNTFSENCYKLQMDESQIESKISFALEQILKNIEEKKAAFPEDFVRVEKLFHEHDRNIRRHLYELARRINVKAKKSSDDKYNIANIIKQFIHEEHETLKEMLLDLQKTILNISHQDETANNTLLIVSESIQDILKVLNNVTSASPWCNSNNLMVSLNKSNNNSYQNSTTEPESEDALFYEDNEEASSTLDSNFQIDLRFGTDSNECSNNTQCLHLNASKVNQNNGNHIKDDTFENSNTTHKPLQPTSNKFKVRTENNEANDGSTSTNKSKISGKPVNLHSENEESDSLDSTQLEDIENPNLSVNDSLEQFSINSPDYDIGTSNFELDSL